MILASERNEFEAGEYMNNDLGRVILVEDINPGNDGSDPRYLTELNGQLYFSASNGTNGREPYVSDGTAEGTKLVKDINPGRGYSSPSGFTELNGQLYFSADDGISGRELYVSDGTTEGTKLIKDINPDRSIFLSPRNLTEYNGKLYFTADDGISGAELYVTDGTTEGTKLVADIRPGSGGSFPTNFTEYNGKLYFSASNGTLGPELYVSDGTTEGTKLVADINPGGYPSFPSGFTEYNGKLYFRADNGTSGGELFVTDGTTEGTKLVIDIRPGSSRPGRFTAPIPIDSNPRYFTEFNGKLYFAASSQLYVTDGTAEGTKLVEGIFPGSNIQNPRDLTVLGNELFFSAENNSSFDRELFKLTFDGTVTQSLNPIAGEDSDDNLLGTDGDDGITGDEANNLIDGGSGNDAIDGGAGKDTIDGGAGTDTIIYQFAPSEVTVTLGEAEAEGTASDGTGGMDFLFNLENVIGSEFNDRITGNSGNNSLTGRDGDDVISGGAGDDFITGSNGADILTGGEGSDRFFYLNPSEGGDTITDFAEGTDKIVLVSVGFNGLTAGELPESRFALGSSATTAEQRLVFDDASGELFYDVDGSGGTAAELVATLTGVTSLSAEDITLL